MIRQTLYRSTYNYSRLGLVNGVRSYSVVGSAKDVLNKANKKIGEVTADGLEKAENVVHSSHPIKKTAHEINMTTGKVLAEGMEKAERVIPTASSEKKRVKENIKGYKDLQDKGSKVESEQGRPEDGV